MEKISCGHVAPALRKPKKKKQVKDELDRLKQAERKKRRLEKALATSAAIRSELEKKKQKKKEEQQRLDEEGAAIAEAVALHVLGDDSDDPCHVVNENRNFDDWKYSGDIGIFMGFESFKMHEGQNLFSSIYGGKYDDWGIGMPLKNGMHGISLQVPCLEVKSHTAELSAGLLAAQALSSLRIADDSQNGKFISDKGTATAVLNRMLKGGGFDNEDTFCENLWAT